MANDNKIQLEVEVSESSISKSFEAVEQRAEKSAKSSAAVFGEYFQNQDRQLKDSIEKIVGINKQTASTSARDAASVFEKEFSRQDEIYKASVKQNIDAAIAAITNDGSIRKSAQESASVFEKAFAEEEKKNKGKFLGFLPKPESLSDFATGFLAVSGAIGIAANAASLIRDKLSGLVTDIIEGDKLSKLEARFDSLSISAGVYGDALLSSSAKASKGLVDTSDIADIASKTFVKLGDNTARLPDIIDLARKTYAVFGGSIAENTEQISQAIFTGNTRTIRQIGLLVDAQEVYKNYAKSIKTTTDNLTDQQKQTALLNAVLEQGQRRFEGLVIKDSVSASFTRLSVSIKDLNDELAKSSNERFGGILKFASDAANSIVSSITDTIKSFKKPKTVDEYIDAIRILREEESKLLSRRSLQPSEDSAGYQQLTNELEAVRQKTFEYAEAVDNLQQASSRELSVSQKANAEIENRQRQIILDKQRYEGLVKLRELSLQSQGSELALAQQRFNQTKTIEDLESLSYQQRKQAEDEFLVKKDQLNRFFDEKGISDQSIRNQSIEQLEETHVNNLLRINEDYKNNLKTANATIAADQFNVFSLIHDSGTQAFENLNKSVQVNLTDIVKSGANAALRIGVDLGQRVGAALVGGKNAFDDFGKTVLGILGDFAIQVGTLLIGIGLGLENLKAGLATFNGAAVAAAGLALVVLGGALKSLSGGTSSAEQPGGAGGGISSGVSSSPAQQQPNLDNISSNAPGTTISVNIQGNVLDRRQTGLELVDVISEAFQTQGVTILGAT